MKNEKLLFVDELIVGEIIMNNMAMQDGYNMKNKN